MDMETGLSNFNFNRLPKFVKKNITHIQKTRKESIGDRYKDKYINESLLIFSEKEKILN